jgi:hypothetical protein
LHPQDCLVTSSAAMSCMSGVCAGSSAALTAQRAELGIGLRGGDEHRVDVALGEFVDAAALALRVASRRVDDQRSFAFGCSGFAGR